MKQIEDLSLPELATVAKEVIPPYNLIIENERIDVDTEILGLFNATDDVSDYYKGRLLACLRVIIDMWSYKEETPEEYDDDTTPGPKYPNKNV